MIDDFWGPNRLMEYRALADAPEVRRVLLCRPRPRPTGAICCAPAIARPAFISTRASALSTELAEVAGELQRQGWLVVHTSALTVDEAVEAILAVDDGLERNGGRSGWGRK